MGFGVPTRNLGIRFSVFNPLITHGATDSSIIGCFSQSVTIVTAYDSMDEKSIQFIVDQSQPKAIFADAHTLPVVSKLMQKGNSGVKAVIYTGQEWEVTDAIKKMEQVENRIFELVHIDELKKTKSASNGDQSAGKGKQRSSEDAEGAQD